MLRPIAALLSVSSLALVGAGCHTTPAPDDSVRAGRAPPDEGPSAQEQFHAPFVFTIDGMRETNGAL